jgi:hypothetical protein
MSKKKTDIDLSKCRVNDLLERRDETVTRLRSYSSRPNARYPAEDINDLTYTKDGKYWSGMEEYAFDIVRVYRDGRQIQPAPKKAKNKRKLPKASFALQLMKKIDDICTRLEKLEGAWKAKK